MEKNYQNYSVVFRDFSRVVESREEGKKDAQIKLVEHNRRVERAKEHWVGEWAFSTAWGEPQRDKECKKCI